MSRPDQGLAVARCNYVGQDDIWKSHVYHETKAAKSWPRNWNFMTTRYRDLVKDEFPIREKIKQETKLPKITPTEERVKVLPSPRPIPRTTAHMIGWRSSLPDLRLERYGRYAKGKGGLIRQLKWPAEGIC